MLNPHGGTPYCTDSLPTQGDRKKWISGACQWMDFLDSKEILHHFINGTYFYERQMHFPVLLLFSYTLISGQQQPWTRGTRSQPCEEK